MSNTKRRSIQELYTIRIFQYKNKHSSITYSVKYIQDYRIIVMCLYDIREKKFTNTGFQHNLGLVCEHTKIIPSATILIDKNCIYYHLFLVLLINYTRTKIRT